MLGGMLWGFFTRTLSDSITPVLSSLATAILGIPVTYAAFRWGNNVGAKRAAEELAQNNTAATNALAQIAGAGPPSPSPPTLSEPRPDTDAPAS
jgi:type II secretory pathway pseudopilin PulG